MKNTLCVCNLFNDRAKCRAHFLCRYEQFIPQLTCYSCHENKINSLYNNNYNILHHK